MRGLVIREGVEADVEALMEVEARAAKLLLDHGGHDLLAMHALSRESLMHGVQAGLLRVAEIAAVPVGFALAGEIDGHAHLFEMDVDPAHGRRGIGSALLESVCEVAAALGLQYITLVTLRDVPWNAPFYARRGFADVSKGQWGPQLSTIVERERTLGVLPETRIVMRRPLPFPPPGEGGAKRRMREWQSRPTDAPLQSDNPRPHPPFGHLLPGEKERGIGASRQILANTDSET